MKPPSDNLAKVEEACTTLRSRRQSITFTAIAQITGISRTTLYRNPVIRAVIEEHHAQNIDDPRTITGLTSEIDHLRTAVQALAARIRNQEERIRQLEQTRKTG
jgi:hypothetical protein